MSANRSQAHVHVIPEDDACRQIAAEFQIHLPTGARRQFYVEPPPGGWRKVLQSVEGRANEMGRFRERRLILVIDFDRDEKRLETARAAFAGFEDRAFVLGVWSEPEHLRKKLGLSFEQIGAALASECGDPGGERPTWSHELLRHNEDEIRRMTPSIRPILFP